MEIAKPLQCWIKTRFRCVSKFHLKVKHFCTARSSKHWRSFSSNAFPPVQILFHKHLKLYKVRKDFFLLSSLIYPRNLEMARYSKTAPQWESVKYDGWRNKILRASECNSATLWVQLIIRSDQHFLLVFIAHFCLQISFLSLPPRRCSQAICVVWSLWTVQLMLKKNIQVNIQVLLCRKKRYFFHLFNGKRQRTWKYPFNVRDICLSSLMFIS